MATASTGYDTTGSDLPETVPVDGSGNDKYYVPPEESRTANHPQYANPGGSAVGFAEHSSSYPERTYKDEDKQAYEITFPVSYLDQKNQGTTTKDEIENAKDYSKHFRLKKWQLILGVVIVVIAVAIAVVVGVVLGLRNTRSSAPTEPAEATSTADPESAVGGYLHPDFYSRSGAWNGTGLAFAAAYDAPSPYIFYQDYTGSIVFHHIDDADSQIRGRVDEGSHKPLNGTPISVVNLLNTTEELLLYHLFYIDANYVVRERVMTNTSRTWIDGKLNNMDAQSMKTYVADRVGMSACFRPNYYGYSSDGTIGTVGMSLLAPRVLFRKCSADFC